MVQTVVGAVQKTVVYYMCSSENYKSIEVKTLKRKNFCFCSVAV